MRLFLLPAVCMLLTGCGRSQGDAPGQVPLQPGVTQPLSQQAGQAAYWIDELGSAVNPSAGKAIQLTVQSEFRIRGWAVDEQAANTAGGVELVLDAKPFRIPYGMDRADVSDARKVAAYRNSGFQTSFPAKIIGLGQHSVSLRILAHDSKSYYETPTFIVLVQK